jgi:hypothetical protein
MHSVDTWPVLHSRISKMAGLYTQRFICCVASLWILINHFLWINHRQRWTRWMISKPLYKYWGDLKRISPQKWMILRQEPVFSSGPTNYKSTRSTFSIVTDVFFNIGHILQRAVTSSNKRAAIRFQELNQKKFRMPLIVTSLTFSWFISYENS